MSAQPIDEIERFPQLAAIERERAEVRARRAWRERPVEQDEPAAEPRFTLTYRDHGKEHVIDLDEVTDEELPESARRWRPARMSARVEDIRFMAEHGETLSGVAARLTALQGPGGRGISRDGVERFLYWHGEAELVWKLKAAEVGEPAPDSPDWWLGGSTATREQVPSSGRAATPRTMFERLIVGRTPIKGVRL